MRPRIHEIQAHLIASIQRQTYNPVEPPPIRLNDVRRLSRKESGRLAIHGDAVLGNTLVSLLFHEFPSKDACFISRIKAALLSNHTFTNILLKARGYSDPNGFPVDKTVADAFEIMGALSYDYGLRKFEEWFWATFMPLVREVESLWNRVNTVFRADTGIPVFLSDISMQSIPQMSWVESIDVATLAPDPMSARSSLCTTEIPRKRRRYDDAPEEQPLPKRRRWVEAMEAAGNQAGPSRSNWVEAMIMAGHGPQPNLAAKENSFTKEGRYAHEKENYRAFSRIAPYRRRTPARHFSSYEQQDGYLDPRTTFRETESSLLRRATSHRGLPHPAFWNQSRAAEPVPPF
ncbi:hypothetical protein C8R44DRAFT_29229 [Mycena epipterygia]|nr:hypothetical protein C8R44DRAFT_29229 [Mycena epipterygia]